MMQRIWTTMTMLAVVTAFSSFATADDAQKKEAHKHAKGMVALTQVVGSEIRNAGNERISSVRDVVINDRGEIVYVIAGTGGFAGILESQVAIPAKAVNCESRMNDGQKETFMTISMTQEKLNQAPKLEADNYAELLNQSWVKQNNEYFSVETANQPGTLMFFSSLNDLGVKTSDGKDFGQIDDFVVSGADHKIKYVILGSGGALNVGKNYSALPFKVLTLTRDQDQQWQASVNVAKEDLEKLPKVTAPNYHELENDQTRKLIDQSSAAVVPAR